MRVVFFFLPCFLIWQKGQIIAWRLRWEKRKEEMSQQQNSVKATN